MAQFNFFEEKIDFSFWREMCAKYGVRRRFVRGEHFVHAGTELREIGWIESGGFKHSIIDSAGNHKAVGFVFQGSILANYVSAVLGKKMPTDIVALEDSEVNLVPAEMLVERLAYDPTFHIAFLQALFTQAYEHILTDYRHTPEERYRMLIKRFPNITECASLSDIASYLNISYRHLHRIRLSHLK